MYQSENTSTNIFTVTKLNRLARSILESEIGMIWLSAEISNFVAASSGHWYFTLKDERAQVRAAMFRGANRRVSTRPKEGDKVLVRANIGLYEARGEYQLVVEHLEPEGEGRLKQQFEQLKIKLAAEGLFSQQYKQMIPASSSTIGVITSATGAALHDILTVLKRRNPALKVIVYPSQVQGESATMQICQALNIANQRNEVDVLILGRGGGSLEDLWCFNEEEVARAIYASAIPIVSAVGHEVDVTIADFVADARAPTPSAAAELVSNDSAAFIGQIKQMANRLGQAMQNLHKQKNYQHQVLNHRLQQNHPKRILQQQNQLLDQLSTSLGEKMRNQLVKVNQRQANLTSRIKLASPQQRINQEKQSIARLDNAINQHMREQLASSQHRLATASQLLDSVSPLATLARGYSITYKDKEIVKTANELQPGDILTNKFVDGEVISEVKT